MTDQPQTALDQFLAAAKRISEISSEASHARGLPDRVRYDVDRVMIQANSGGWNQTIPQRAVEMAERIRDRVHAEFLADAEHERDAKLHALSVEIQSIRAALPSLAASAAIELGHQSRMLAYEASGVAL